MQMRVDDAHAYLHQNMYQYISFVSRMCQQWSVEGCALSDLGLFWEEMT